MEGGGQSGEGWKLGDIGDYRDANDIWPIASASIVSINLSLALTRFGGIGGFSLNTFFDTFGLEGLLANASWIVILFQAARWVYTSFYSSGGRTWSPFVFVCILLAVQVVHDLLFYYGLLKSMPTGRNEMLDGLKRYANENGQRAIGSHSAYFILTAVIAMFLKESSFLFAFLLVNVALYLIPFVISTSSYTGIQKVVSSSENTEKQPASRTVQANGRPAGEERRIASWNSMRGDF